MDSADTNRRSKRDYITIDDDAPNDQPAAKITAVPAHSSEVLQLQKKVAELQLANDKLEKNYEGACRIAGEAQARVQFLEKLVDTKSNVVDSATNTDPEAEEVKDKRELVFRVTYLTKKLDEEIKRNLEKDGELEKKVIGLKKELDQVRVDRINKLRDLSSKLTAENRKNNALLRENESLKLEMDELRRKFDEQPPEEHQEQPWVVHMQPPRMPHRPPPPPFMQQFPSVGRTTVVLPDGFLLHQNAHPTNILQVCHSDAPDTFSLDSALAKVDTLMREHGRANVFQHFGNRMKDDNCAPFGCEVCHTQKFYGPDVLGHFLSHRHINYVRDHRGAVSFAAFQHWFQQLELTWDAAAAAPTVGGGTKNV